MTTTIYSFVVLERRYESFAVSTEFILCRCVICMAVRDYEGVKV